MALQLSPYHVPGDYQVRTPAYTGHSAEGAIAAAKMIADAGANLGNSIGGAMQQQRADERNQALGGIGELLNNGDYAGAAKIAAANGQPELAMKLGMSGYENKQAQAAYASLGDILGGGGGGGMPTGAASGGGAPAASSGGGGHAGGNAATAYKMFIDMGYSPQAAAGIVGNLVQESGVRPVGASGDGGTAHGIAQWRADRWNSDHGLLGYAKQNNLDPGALGTQVKFLDWELKNRYGDAYKAVMNARSPEEAAGMFALKFERPRGAETGNYMNIDGIGNRIRQAKSIYGSGAGSEQGPQSATQATAQAPTASQTGVTTQPDMTEAQRQSIYNRVNNMSRALLLPGLPDGAKSVINAQLAMEKEKLGIVNEQAKFDREQAGKYGFEAYQTENQRETARQQAGLEGGKAWDRQSSEGLAKSYDGMRTQAEGAYKTLGTLNSMKQAMADPNFYSGSGAGIINASKKWGASLGLQPESISSPNQVFGALANRLTLDANNGSLGAGVSNSDVAFLASVNPNENMTPQAIQRLIGIAEKNEQGKILMFNEANKYAQGHGGRLDIGWDAEAMRLRGERANAGQQPSPGMPQVGAAMDGYTFLGGDPSKPSSWKKN